MDSLVEGGALPGRSSAWLLGTGVADTPRTHTPLDGRFRPPGRVPTQLIGLTVHAMPEGFRGPVRISVGDEVRELGAGDSWVFDLSQQSEPAGQSHLSDEEGTHRGGSAKLDDLE
jgi:hypothetical protein